MDLVELTASRVRRGAEHALRSPWSLRVVERRRGAVRVDVVDSSGGSPRVRAPARIARARARAVGRGLRDVVARPPCCRSRRSRRRMARAARQRASASSSTSTRRALADHEAVAVGSNGRLRASGSSLRGESAHMRRSRPRRSARSPPRRRRPHHVGLAAPDDRSASPMAWALVAQAETGDQFVALASNMIEISPEADIGDHHRHQEWRDPARSALQHRLDAALQAGDAADARADYDAGPLGAPAYLSDPRLSDRLIGRGDGEVDEAVGSTRQLRPTAATASKPRTSPAMREAWWPASNWLIEAMPDRPSTKPAQDVATSSPSGLTAPMPVTTTRLPTHLPPRVVNSPSHPVTARRLPQAPSRAGAGASRARHEPLDAGEQVLGREVRLVEHLVHRAAGPPAVVEVGATSRTRRHAVVTQSRIRRRERVGDVRHVEPVGRARIDSR